jgi:hypothetical protein
LESWDGSVEGCHNAEVDVLFETDSILKTMITERALKPSDIPVLEKEIASDEVHASWMNPSFFLEPQTLSVALDDEQGTTMFLRMESVMRFSIQFCDVDKERIRQVVIKQFPSLVQRARNSGYKQIIFDSRSLGLVQFIKKHFRIRHSPDEYVLELSSFKDQASECAATARESSLI